jgi:outer membrane protein assembly factor BamB
MASRRPRSSRALTRRSSIAAAAAVLGLGVAAAEATAADWAQLGYSARRVSNSSSETALGLGNVGGLRVLWQKSWRCGGIAPPVVAGGQVFVGSTDRVCVFDASTGATLLQIPAGDSTDSSPAVATIGGKRRLFVSSLDGALYSFAANTGRLLWKLQTGGPLHSSPAIDGGRVYVGSEDGRLYAVDAITGTVAWSQGTGGPVYGSPAVGFGGVFVIGAAKLHGFEATTGAPRFVTDFAEYGGTLDNGVTPAVLTDSHYAAGGAVFFANGAKRDAFVLIADPMTGQLVNGCPAFTGGTTPRLATFAIGHGILYFQTVERLFMRNASHCGSRINRLVNYPAVASWPVSGSPSFGAPAFANGVVYSGSSAFAPLVTSSTPPVWSAGTSASSPSVIADGRLFALTAGKLVAYGIPATP